MKVTGLALRARVMSLVFVLRVFEAMRLFRLVILVVCRGYLCLLVCCVVR